MSFGRIRSIVGWAVLVALCGGLLGPVRAQDATEVLRKLERKYDSIRDATVTFTQHVVFAVTKAEQSFSGTLTMKKGNKYRIDLEQQTIVTDGKSVWSFNKVTGQVLIDRYKDDPRSFTPDKVLVNVPANYEVTVLGTEKLERKDATVLKLAPKTKSTGIKWMKVWVDRSDWLMRRIQTLDVSENLTTYDVHEAKLNTGVADTLFRFQPPPDAEVVDLR